MTQEIRNIVPVQETIYCCPTCTNLDELSVDVAFLGFPYEQGCRVTLPSGKSKGPRGIRSDRKTYRYYGDSFEGEADGACGWFDMDADKWQLRGVTMADCGDVNILPAEGEKNVDRLTNCERLTEVMVKILNRGAFPVVMGGDHTQPYPIMKAFGKFSKFHPIDIVHFDAHHDFVDSMGGAKINDGDCIKRVSDLPFVHRITQIGINRHSRWTPVKKEAYDAAVKRGNNIISREKFRQMGVNQVLQSIPQAKSIYVTIDIDCFDCSVAPGISGQEVDGLSYLDVEQTLIGIATRGKVIGFDVTGLIPAQDTTNITMRLTTNLITDFLTAIFPSKA